MKMVLRKQFKSVLSQGLITNHLLQKIRKLLDKFNSRILLVALQTMQAKLLGCKGCLIRMGMGLDNPMLLLELTNLNLVLMV